MSTVDANTEALNTERPDRAQSGTSLNRAPSSSIPFPTELGQLQISENWVTLSFDQPRPCLSSAVVNGGLVETKRWINLRVSGDQADAAHCPTATVAALCQQQEWADDPAPVAMMTAASMDSLRVRFAEVCGELLAVLVTTGLANARRAGDRAEYRHLSDHCNEVGTINIAVVTSTSLSTAVMAECMITATEAKTAVLQKHGVISPISGELATGTGTDSVAIFAGNGEQAAFAGKHTIFGEVLARLVIEGIDAAADKSAPTIAKMAVS